MSYSNNRHRCTEVNDYISSSSKSVVWNIPGIHLLFIIFYIVCECTFKEIDDEYAISMDADDTSLMMDGLVSTDNCMCKDQEM